MKIYKPKITYQDGKAIISSDFKYSKGEETLWYSVDEKYSKYLTTETSDGFLVGLLLLAMKNDEDIYLEAPVSEKLFYNLTNYYMKQVSLTIKGLKNVKIMTQELVNVAKYQNPKGVCTGFSGGIDSFCLIYDHLKRHDIPDSYKITHFVFNNVGSHGEYDSEKASKLFDQRFDLLKDFPNELNKDFIKIDSNLSDILMMKYELSHTPRNVSCILLLQKLFCKYQHASAFHYSNYKISRAPDIAFIEPSINLLSTETLECILVGSQYTRTQKTELITHYEPTKRYLNVCAAQSAHNCSACFKCLRTLFTLDILGKLNKYKDVFDLEKYKKEKQKFIFKLMLKRKTDLFLKEIFELAREKDYEFGILANIVNFIVILIPKRFIEAYLHLKGKYKI